MGKRIALLISLVPPSDRLVDVGTDHGQVAMGLAKREDIGQVLATDISPACLAKLERSLEKVQAPWVSKIQTQLADGLIDLSWDQADTVVISGMGGGLVWQILQAGSNFLQGTRWLVLGPQSQLSDFRKGLIGAGYWTKEVMVEEGGQYYTLFLIDRTRPIQPAYARALDDPFLLKYGPLLNQEGGQVFQDFLTWRLDQILTLRKKLSHGGGQARQNRIKELDEEGTWIKTQIKDGEMG